MVTSTSVDRMALLPFQKQSEVITKFVLCYRVYLNCFCVGLYRIRKLKLSMHLFCINITRKNNFLHRLIQFVGVHSRRNSRKAIIVLL